MQRQAVWIGQGNKLIASCLHFLREEKGLTLDIVGPLDFPEGLTELSAEPEDCCCKLIEGLESSWEECRFFAFDPVCKSNSRLILKTIETILNTIETILKTIETTLKTIETILNNCGGYPSLRGL